MLTQPGSIIPTSKNICSLQSTFIASVRVDVFETGRKCMVVHAPLINFPLHTPTQTASKKCGHYCSTEMSLKETATIRWGTEGGGRGHSRGDKICKKKKKNNIMNQEKFMFYTEKF